MHMVGHYNKGEKIIPLLLIHRTVEKSGQGVEGLTAQRVREYNLTHRLSEVITYGKHDEKIRQEDRTKRNQPSRPV
jgi:hypothetical protein